MPFNAAHSNDESTVLPTFVSVPVIKNPLGMMMDRRNGRKDMDELLNIRQVQSGSKGKAKTRAASRNRRWPDSVHGEPLPVKHVCKMNGGCIAAHNQGNDMGSAGAAGMTQFGQSVSEGPCKRGQMVPFIFHVHGQPQSDFHLLRAIAR